MRPFWCGGQYGDWKASNCERCTKGIDNVCPDNDSAWPTCEIEAALVEAYCSSGEISDEIAQRMGRNDAANLSYGWPCGEVEWTEEWKAEYLERELHHG